MSLSIAFITTERIYGGGESNLLLLAKVLQESGYIIEIFAPKIICQKASRLRIKTYEFDPIYKSWFKGYDVIKNNSHIRLLTNRLDKFDIIHAYNSNCLPFIKFSKTKIIYTCHGPWEITSQRKANLITTYVDRIITVSRPVYEYLRLKNIYAEIIPLGCTIKSEINNKITLNNEIFKILCLARFQPIKGQILLVISLIILVFKGKIPKNKLKLIFAGKANNIKDNLYYYITLLLSRILVINGLEVIFLGHVENTYKLLRETDIVIVPSRYESFSMVSVEALSSGTPVIYPIGTACQDIINKETYGLGFVNGSPFSLARAIKNMYNRKDFNKNHARDMIIRANDFSIEKQMKKTIKIYNDLR